MDASLEIAVILFNELMQRDMFDDLVSRRGGIILWLVSLSRAMDLCKLEVNTNLSNSLNEENNSGIHKNEDWHSWGQYIGSTVVSSWKKKLDKESLEDVLHVRLSKKKNNTTAETETEIIRDRSDDTNSHSEREKDSAQLLFARILSGLLQLKHTPIARQLSSIISRLPTDILIHIASSGPLSRAIFDTYFDTCVSKKDLNHLLSTSFVLICSQLASHYCGQHVFRRAFECADINTKELITKEIASKREYLSKSKEGRSSLSIAHAETYIRHRDQWTAQMKKHAKGLDMLNELFAVSGKTKANSTEVRSSDKYDQSSAMLSNAKRDSQECRPMMINNDDDNEDDNDNDLDATNNSSKVNRTRKRKRKKSNTDRGTLIRFEDTAENGIIANESESKKVHESDNINEYSVSDEQTNAGKTNDIDDIFAPKEANANKDSKPVNKSRKKQKSSSENNRVNVETSEDKTNTMKRRNANSNRNVDKKIDMAKIMKLKTAKLISTASINEEIKQIQREKSFNAKK